MDGGTPLAKKRLSSKTVKTSTSSKKAKTPKSVTPMPTLTLTPKNNSPATDDIKTKTPNKTITMSAKKKTTPKAKPKKKENAAEEHEPVVQDVDMGDEKEDEAKHATLLKSIQSLDGKKAAISVRGETVLRTSEYHNREAKSVPLGKLLKSHASKERNVNKYISQSGEPGKLPKPVEKIYLKKAEREVKYLETKSEVDKWQTIVEENRVVPQQQFPLERSRISIPTATSEAKLHKPQNAMEVEIQTLLRGQEFIDEQAKLAAGPVLTKAEERAQKAMDVAKAREEMSIRRKHRMMVSELASKNRRQGKIKSRSYHRHLKVERRKTAFKALEKLKSEDPETWKDKAEEIERARIEERATLRHKGRSQFAKLAKRYGKFNEKIKDSLDEMRAKGVELMTKQPGDESSGAEEEESEEEQRGDVDMEDSDSDGELAEPANPASQNNPWMRSKLSKEKAATRQPYKKPEPLLNTAAFDEGSSSDSDGEAQEVDGLIRQRGNSDSVVLIEPDMSQSLQDERKRAKARKQSKGEAVRAAEELEQDADEMVAGQSTLRIQTRSEVDRFDAGFSGTADAAANSEESSDEEAALANSSRDLDPNKVISIPSTDLSGAVKPHTGDSESEDDQHRLNIAEAFADDDVVEEFSARRKRKHDEEDAAEDAAEALNTLPGWGKWSGAGIKETKSRKKMSRWEKEKQRVEDLKKATQKMERDEKRSKYPKGVMINESALCSQPIAKYQVQSRKSRLTSEGFKALMSHPVGKDFVPTLAHNELCQPKIVTSIGTIIAPMNRDQVKEGKKETFPMSTADPNKRIAKQYSLEPLRRNKWSGSKEARQLIKS